MEQMHACHWDEWAADTALSSHFIHGSSPCAMTAWLLANTQPILWSRLLFLSLSLFRIFCSWHFCHSSWDLKNDGTDLLPRGSTALKLQLLWSLVRESSCACGIASFLTYQRHCSEMTGGKAGSTGFAPGMLNASSCKWIWDLFRQWPCYCACYV